MFLIVQLSRLQLVLDGTGDEGEVVGKQNEGHYKIRFKHALKPGSKLKAPFERVLGTWWIEAAAGTPLPSTLP